ncbi:glycosyltransferase family 4 protein [Candidatus Woesearchaeota archaeon]|nr:glycosyltransferase family 4 protein [Candidatus Woesearchaeota archaeon]
MRFKNLLKRANKKKRIMLVANIPGWAWDRKSRAIKKYLSKYYDFDIAYSKNKDTSFDGYDAVLLFYHVQHKRLRENLEKFKGHIFLGVSSCFEVSKSFREGDGEKTVIELAKRNNVSVFVNNKFLINQFKNKIDKIYYNPNGVDINEFKTKTRIKNSSSLVVGFAGNSESKCVKGIYDIIIPAIKDLKNVSIKYLDKIKNPIPLKKMPRFYNKIDCYICASETEGTPNPCLEAAACGRPLITTRVGNMPELVIDGENSLFVDRTIEDIKEKVIFYRDNKDKLIEHGKKIQKEIIKNWNWKKAAQNYKLMFDDVLNRFQKDL